MKPNSMQEKDIRCFSIQAVHEVADLFLACGIDIMPVMTPSNTVLGWIKKEHLYQVMAQHCDLDKTIEQLIADQVIELAQSKTSLPQEKNFSGVMGKDNFPKRSNRINPLMLNMQLRAVIESLHNGLIVIDSESRIIIFNRPAEIIFGIKQKQVMGRFYKDVFPEGNLDELLQTRQANPAQKVIYRNKILVSNRTPLMDGEKIVGAISVLQDISEFEHISKELQYTKKLQTELEGIIAASFDSLVVTDEKGKILRINQSYSRWSGIDHNQIIGRNMYDLVNEGMYDRSAAVLVIESGKQVTFTQNVNTGKVLCVTGTPIFNDEGKLVRVVINVRDITELNKLKIEVEKAHSLSKHYEEELQKATRSGDMIIASVKLKEVMEVVKRVGKVDSTVLVYGESGVGKELIAKELLKHSPRKDKPFIVINCAAIPESLLESELFGYASGTFTGAKKGGKMGIFEVANGGTLFLDEIGEMPLQLQAKLLRVIQEKEVIRLGSSTPVPVDVRIITATNRNLRSMVENGEFREDLYYRLSVVPVLVPPLRERKEDIPALVDYFVSMMNKKYAMNKSIHYKLFDQLVSYNWPGNVRELKNVIERAVVTSVDDVITSIKIMGNNSNDDDHEVVFTLDSHPEPDIDYKKTIEVFEKNLLEKYIKQYKTSRKVAKALGMSQSMVVRKASYFGIVLNKK